MSTTNQVIGNDEELSQFLRDTVAEELAKAEAAKAGTAGAPQVAPSTTIPVTLNGQTFNFNSPEELSQSFQTLVNTYNQQLESAKAAVPATKGAEVTGKDDAAAFNLDTFVQKMTTNPPEAFEYVDELRYGVKNPTAAIKAALASREDVDNIKKALAIYQFRDSHPEFNANPQTAGVISNIIQSQGLPQNLQGLEAAYALGVVKGLLPHPQFAQQQQQGQRPQSQTQQGFAPNNPYANPGFDPRAFNGGFGGAAPPPRVNRDSTDPVPDLASLAESMTPEQIETVFRRLQG